jgi:hypothetical protein
LPHEYANVGCVEEKTVPSPTARQEESRRGNPTARRVTGTERGCRPEAVGKKPRRVFGVKKNKVKGGVKKRED